VLAIGPDGAEIVDSVAEDYVFVDGRGVGDVGQGVLEDRRSLSRNGFWWSRWCSTSTPAAFLTSRQDRYARLCLGGEAVELMDRLKREIQQRGATRRYAL
jgi:mRNA degradation ribonuclease J1/J2